MGKHYPIKKGLVVAVIFLFAGMSVIPSIGTTVVNNSSMTAFYDGSLSGYVNNTLMNPIEGARVRVHFHGTYEEDYTDSSGYYHVTNIPICWCYKNCTASKEGYETEWVWLGIYENTTYNFVLTPLTQYDGSLSGYVNNTLMNPIEGARVRVHFHGTYEEDYTDSSGYYHVTNIPICWCYKNCTASKEGYETEWVWLGIYENTTYNFVLTPLTQYDGSLSGYVNNTLMNPIEGARVRVHFHGTYEEDYTDSSGYYRVTNIPICYCLKNATASKVGYETEWILLSITENTTHDFVLTSLDPVPDLDCDGCLCWTDVEPGETVTGEFTVENVGDPESLLDWEIESHPDWGTWSFDPYWGEDLIPEDGVITIQVEIIFPEENFEPYGYVKIVNSEDPDDFCIIDIVIQWPPPEFWYTFIGFIDKPIFSNESITFHADFVFVFWTIIPTKPIFNEQISLPNEYRGFIGDNFILARFHY